jgi:murein DD-endopeptidase MepM/ murein hydrolase activator NlpD
MRVHPVTGVYKLHDGTDFGAGCGTPIRAARGGEVVWASGQGAYGNQVLLDSGWVGGKSLMTSYSHMTGFAVGGGQQVATGQVIGYVGSTGYSTGCHLHFMVYRDGATTDPMNYL